MLSAGLPTSTTVVSSADSKSYLRLVTDGEELTLPVYPASKTHRSFILATWVKSYAPVLRKWLGDGIGLEEEAQQAETLWGQTLVCGSENDEFTIHAWVCGSPGVLHYVYVPPDLRGKGIAGALIRHVCGHKFQYGRPWPFRKEPSGGQYNPYLLGQG
jgi:GNAT superfamily N-acetyltransferase